MNLTSGKYYEMKAGISVIPMKMNKATRKMQITFFKCDSIIIILCLQKAYKISTAR